MVFKNICLKTNGDNIRYKFLFKGVDPVDSIRCGKTQIEVLRSKLNEMLLKSGGEVCKDIVELSQVLDKLILQELEINSNTKKE